MPEEKGTHNVEISDSEKKLDALADMIRDACGRMDSVGSRMDAMEEGFKRADARMDAMDSRHDSEEKEEKREDRKDAEEKEEREEKDARRDSEDEKEVREKGDPKEPAADKGRKDSEEKEEKREDRKDARRDSEEEEKKEEREDRKDARKDEDAEMDDAPISRAEAAALRAQIKGLQARTPAILADGDRERFARIQEQADTAFQAFGDRAPAPLDGETPTQYKRRLGTKMQAHSDKWKDTRLSAIADDSTLDVIVGEVFADSVSAARRGVAVPAGQLREITRHSGGHTIIEFEGAADSWMNDFSGVSMRATGSWHRPH